MNTSLRNIIVMSALLFVSSATIAQVRPFGFYEAEFSPDLTILNSSSGQIRFRLDMSRLQPSGQVDLAQRLPGTWADMNYNGLLMPRFTFFLALPPTGNPTVSVEDWQTITRSAVVRSIPENVPDSPHVSLGDVGILGGVRIVPVTVKPVTYVNLSANCQVLTQATITIDIDGQQGENPISEVRMSFSEPWQKMLRATVANWEDIPNILIGEASHILMFVPQAYQASLSYFFTWKEQRGIKVTVVPTEDIDDDQTGEDLRQRIIDEVNAATPRIDFVLFVGDETIIPVHPDFTSDPFSRFSDFSYPGSYTNENFFAAIEGTDEFPDVFLGRWVVNTLTEARNIANRTKTHELNPFEFDSTRFEQSVVAADYTEITQRMTKQRARQIMLAHGMQEVDTLWGQDNPSPGPLLTWLTEGLAFVNYRGSGWNFGWAGINFWIGTISSIDNVGRLPIVTGIGCGVGKFDEAEGNCFGERWMLGGSANDPVGAVGFIGPCWNTHTAYNDNLDTCLYRAMFDYRSQNLSAALATGKMFTWALFDEFLGEPEVREITETLFRQYVVLCDPSLQVYTDTPQRAQISFSDVIPAGPFNLPIYVAGGASLLTDSLLLTFWTAPGVFTSFWIDPLQEVTTLPVNFPANSDVIVTLTGENILARQWTLTVGSIQGVYLMHSGIEISDEVGGNGDARIQPGESLYIADTVWNIGSDAAFSVVGTLTIPTEGVTVLEGSAGYGDIAQGQRALGQPFYHCSVADSGLAQGSITFHFTYSANGVEPRTDSVMATLYVPEVIPVGTRIDDANEMLDRGEVAGLSVILRNVGNDTFLPGSITLTSGDDYLHILDGSATLQALAPGESYIVPASELQVSAALNTPSGYVAPLHCEISGNMESYVYRNSIDLTLTIGSIGPSDPTSGTDGLYWMYDDTDVNYDRAAVYDWFEISPTVDGPGTLLDVAQGNQAITVPVPFEYSYFGLDFNTLSISVDGWVCATETVQPSFINNYLPYENDAVEGLIAVLWNDFWAFAGEDGDVSYFYDTVGDRFIVEWHNISDWQTGAHVSTFQVQLLNPATHITPNGDAEWLFMYQDIDWHANSAAGATIGYENPGSQFGSTYYHVLNYAPGGAPLQDSSAIRLTTAPPVILATDERAPVSADFRLLQNFPNPFNPETTISFSLPRSTQTTLDIFNLLGRRIARLYDGQLSAGSHAIQWIGKDENGVAAPTGIYFYRLATPLGMQTRRMLLLK